jgi:DNA-binding XRE family transcriptional regulator
MCAIDELARFPEVPGLELLRNHRYGWRLRAGRFRVVLDGRSLRPAWREYLELTQAEVAARMGVSQPAPSQLESPRARPRRATLARLAKALGVRDEQLM